MPPRLTPEDYFEAAIEILSADGDNGLTMTRLHERLGVTSGSFYHAFPNWPDFVERLLAHWVSHYTDDAADNAERDLDPGARLGALRRRAHTHPHDTEAAIRTWSTVDPVVGPVQRWTGGAWRSPASR